MKSRSQAGLGKATLYLYFPSKEVLLQKAGGSITGWFRIWAS